MGGTKWVPRKWQNIKADLIDLGIALGLREEHKGYTGVVGGAKWVPRRWESNVKADLMYVGRRRRAEGIREEQKDYSLVEICVRNKWHTTFNCLPSTYI